MSAEKISVSFDAELLARIRGQAAREGVPLSSWLAEAARAAVRDRALRDALDAFDAEHGPISDAEAERLVAESRKRSVVSNGGRKRRRRA